MMINLTTIFILICVVIPGTCVLIYANKEMEDVDVMLRIAMFLFSLGIFIMMIGWCWTITC
jgi:hypothetical protein